MLNIKLSRFAWGVLALNILVIVWGAYVRATGSGAGCGSHWPTCNGEVIPRDPGVETLIEYSHRTTSGMALLAVIGLLVLTFRRRPKGHGARSAAVASMILILTEAAIGAGLVIFGLVEDNDSMMRAFFIALHLANTFLLLAALTLCAHWSSGAPAVRHWRSRSATGRAPGLFWISIAGTLLIGISGAVAALGDTLFPAESLAEGLAQDFATGAHIFIKLRTFHPFIAVTGSVVMLMLVNALRREGYGPAARRFANLLNVLVFVQIAAGGVNILLLAPVWMQLIHLFLADLLWITLVLTGSELLTDPRS